MHVVSAHSICVYRQHCNTLIMQN